MLVFAAAGKLISAFARNKEVENVIGNQCLFQVGDVLRTILTRVSLVPGGDALPRTQTRRASAAPSGGSFGLCWPWRWSHRLGCPRRRWGCRTCLLTLYTSFAPTHLLFCVSDIYLRLEFNPASFDVSAMLHPSTYLNKVLLGSSQGALQLWNIKTRLAYEDVCWGWWKVSSCATLLWS